MGKRGKPWTPSLTRIKDGKGREVGNYRMYVPSEGRTVNLGTLDEKEAWRKAKEIIAREKGASDPVVLDRPMSVPELPTPPRASGSAPSNAPSIDPNSLLDSWAADKPSPLPPQPDSPAGPVPAPPEVPFVEPTKALVATPKAKTQKGLTPEQAEKLGKGLQKLVARVNIVTLELAVRFMGRDPYPLDDEEVELLALGWELWLDTYFVKHKPEPWMLILAGNVMAGFGMWMRGTPIVKEKKNGHPVGA